MKDLSAIAERIWRVYFPKLEGKVKRMIFTPSQRFDSEEFEAEVEGGILFLSASSSIAVHYAISQMVRGISSGYLSEVSGVSKPLFPLRPLWVASQQLVTFDDDCSIALPSWMVRAVEQKNEEEEIISFADRLIDLGYNSVMFGEGIVSLSKERSSFSVNELFSFLRARGLQVILKPTIDFLDYITLFLKGVGEVDYLFVDYKEKEEESSLTQYEKVREQIVEIETAIENEASSTSLIFNLLTSSLEEGKRQAEWFGELCDSVSNRTTLAFSAVAASAKESFAPLNPIWEALRGSPDSSSTPLLPLINGGMLSQGEGLWPTIPFELMEQIFQRMEGEPFAGALSMVHHLPKEGTFLDGALWVMAQRQWRKLSTSQLVKSWEGSSSSSCWNEEVSQVVQKIICRIRRLQNYQRRNDNDVNELAKLRLEAEEVLAALSILKVSFPSQEEEEKEEPLILSLADYLRYFIRDAKRLLFSALQYHQINIPNVLDGDDLKEGFWTSLDQPPGKGMSKCVKVSVLQEPFCSKDDKVMPRILQENSRF